YPDIWDLFTSLRFPGKAGKAYAKRSESETNVSQEKEIIQPNFFDNIKCRHGLLEYACDVCRRDARNKTRRPARKNIKNSRTADVFDLLLPYLQPPIEALLAQPLLFPPNRRPYDYQITGIRFLLERSAALLG